METKAEVYIPLSQGKVAVIDFEDFDLVRGMKWHANKGGHGLYYAVRNVPLADGTRTAAKMHRVITGCPPGLEVNHINGDGLDNRRQNLQVCTSQQNAWARCRKKNGTSSKYRGVLWSKQSKRWRARLMHNDKRLHLGYFNIEEDAARAYDTAAIKYFGEHAAPNFPTQTDTQCLIKDGAKL